MTEEQKEDIKLLKELIADKSIPNDDREIYQEALNQILAQTKSDMPKLAKEKMPRKEKATTKAKASKKPKAEKPTQLPTDVDAMKKAIKERTGKTEAECEDIIAQYRKLRDKAKVNRAKRTEKLKTDDKLITGTNVITPVAQIEKDAEIVKAKIEKQVEQIENKAEREVVKKDKTKDEVKVEVEQKVVKQLAKLSDEMVSSATTFVKNIQTELKKVDKTEAKKFLLGLRNEIDVLLSKFADGGLQTYNITENMSVSSVNPSKFNRGGRLEKRMMSNTRMANDGRVATFKIGDRWKPNFDYEGMLKVGSSATISMGIDTLRELSYSFEDVNYHTINADLIRAIDFLKMGEDNQAHKSLDKFNKNCSEELNSINFERGGSVDGGDFVRQELNFYKKGGGVQDSWRKSGQANLSKEETKKIALKYADGLSMAGMGKFSVNNKIDEDSFDLDLNDIEYDGGSYNIFGDGSVVNMAITPAQRYGSIDSTPLEIKNKAIDIQKQLKDIGEDLENYSNYDEFYNVVFDYIKREENLTEEEAKDICIVNESIIEAEFEGGSSPRFTGDVVLGYLSNERGYMKKGGVTGKDNRAKKVIRNVNGFEREYPIGDAWRKEHKLENKSEKYEVPYSSRKS